MSAMFERMGPIYKYDAAGRVRERRHELTVKVKIDGDGRGMFEFATRERNVSKAIRREVTTRVGDDWRKAVYVTSANPNEGTIFNR